MDKNRWILPVGVALMVVNLILTVLLVVFALPPLTQVNKIVTRMDQVLDLEYMGNDETTYPIDQLEIVSLEEKITANITAIDGSDHKLQFNVGITINSDASDAKKVISRITEKEIMVKDTIRNIASSKTYEEIKEVGGDKALAEEMKEALNTILETDAVVEIVFDNYIYN